MTFSKNYQSFFAKANMQLSQEEFVLFIQELILSSTPQSLHSRIKQKISDLNFDVHLMGKSSEYKYESNTVFINSQYIKDINVLLHEIMHAIGTERHKSFVNIGLNKRFTKKVNKDKYLNINFGYGANEGLNQHYTETFVLGHAPIAEVSSEYSFCANIMASVAEIVGQDTAKFAHFSGLGLDYFIKQLVQNAGLNNENKALKLIFQLDSYKTIARTHIVFGAPYSPDPRFALMEAYKTLISIALQKAKKQGVDIIFGDIINTKHLTGDNLAYFNKYILNDLIQYFVDEKLHIKLKENAFQGITYKPFIESVFLLTRNFLEKKNLGLVQLPDWLKSGEFYNFVLLNTKIAEQDGEDLSILTSDFQKELTLAIFDPQNDMLPAHQGEFVQLVNQILASRNVVRCGAEISDEYILSATVDEKFNVYLMDAMPDYYKQMFEFVSLKAKSNPRLLNKMLEEVFKTPVELYNFFKQMPSEILKDERFSSLFEKYEKKLQEMKERGKL